MCARFSIISCRNRQQDLVHPNPNPKPSAYV